MATPLSKQTTDLDDSTVIARGGKAVQAGTAAQHAAYTGELGEVTYDTDDNRLVAHDGTTAGGSPMATEAEAVAASASAGPVGAEITYAAGLATVATLGVAVKLVAVTAAKGDANGFTVGTDNTLTATFTGTKLCHVKGRFLVDNETADDAITLHVFVDSASVFETAAQTVTAATQKFYEIDVLLNITLGDTIEIFAENEDTSSNVDTIVAAERVDAVPAHGFLRVTA